MGYSIDSNISLAPAFIIGTLMMKNTKLQLFLNKGGGERGGSESYQNVCFWPNKRGGMIFLLGLKIK